MPRKAAKPSALGPDDPANGVLVCSTVGLCNRIGHAGSEKGWAEVSILKPLAEFCTIR